MIGIIGGSGLEDPKLLKDFEEKKIETKFGKPSGAYTIGKLNGVEVAVLSRHGKTHSINPTNVNYRANIWGFKEFGVKAIIASSACGSLQEKIKPGELVFPNQFIDRTTKRDSSFYDKDRVCHISMANPFCFTLRNILTETAKKSGIKFHSNKTVITIEGPRFGTKAEGHVFQKWGAHVINMTTVPEVVLAREAGIHYQTINIVTDYDCVIEREEAVNLEMVLEGMKKSAQKTREIISKAATEINKTKFECTCEKEIKNAII
ncbi:MAG: S-methyl-5'-thioadenosine phosphorylase [Candidatus Diapherotrites archaeon]